MFGLQDIINDHLKVMVADVTGIPISESEMSNKDNEDNINKKIHGTFRLPLDYLPETQKFPLLNNVASDLELTESVSNKKSMYQHLFQPTHPFAEAIIIEWKKQYTNDITYLEDTQRVIQETDVIPRHDYVLNHAAVMDIWKGVKEETYFLEKYCFVEWDVLKSLNRSPGFLQLLSVGNLMSPMASLMLPLVFFIFPFIILKFRGIPITFSVYLDVLKDIAKNHFIGKTLLNMGSISFDKLIYLMLMLGLYAWQIYQNVLTCYRFYNNIHKINTSLYAMREYLGASVINMDAFINLHSSKIAYSEFCKDANRHCEILRKFSKELEPIEPFSNGFLSKISQVGYLLKCYYELHANQEYEDALRYSFGFEGYLDNLRGLKHHLLSGKINTAKFGSSSCKIENQFYPAHKDDAHVSNSCDLKCNAIITGPNASGKTTFLKTTTLNIIFSQQIGCGFYGKCVIYPYTHIHSYLNIPDTSERDSLFQAESRRCKEIIDSIRNHPEGRHYCIFDELYSGTNPTEAAKSAQAFLKYLSNYENVNFVLTTHYSSICKKLAKLKGSRRIKNYKMDVVIDEKGKLEYTYKICKGVSKVHGAIRVLEDMDYPCEIIDEIKQSGC
jgi:hypothetical protein